MGGLKERGRERRRVRGRDDIVVGVVGDLQEVVMIYWRFQRECWLSSLKLCRASGSTRGSRVKGLVNSTSAQQYHGDWTFSS